MNKKKFVSTWGNATSVGNRRPENYAKNLTLRYPIHPMFDGEALKITFDNFCGTEAITITEAYVAENVKNGGKEILEDTSKGVIFGGKTSITIPAGECVVSDPISFEVKKGKDISVSMYFGDFTEMRSAVLITGPLSKGYFSVGNVAGKRELPLDTTRSINWFYFLTNVEVLTDEENRAIICYGDSITSQSWPDFLTLRLEEEGYSHTAIIRRAASGTRILRQYDNITYDSYGIKGATRFPREILVPGADTIIIQHGINDIIHPVGVEVNPFRPWSDLPTAEEMIEGLRSYIDLAKRQELKVYMGTLLPIYGWRTYAPFREELRGEINEWIRTTKEIDGCIDFDQAVRNPEHLEAFGVGFDSGDHLHPSDAAYKRMAETVPESILK